MNLNNWSIVKTADRKGVSIVNRGFEGMPEICIALRGGKLHINVYEMQGQEGIDDPMFSTAITTQATRRTDK